MFRVSIKLSTSTTIIPIVPNTFIVRHPSSETTVIITYKPLLHTIMRTSVIPRTQIDTITPLQTRCLPIGITIPPNRCMKGSTRSLDKYAEKTNPIEEDVEKSLETSIQIS